MYYSVVLPLYNMLWIKNDAFILAKTITAIWLIMSDSYILLCNSFI